MSSSSFSRRLPHLPLETQAAILRFCDVSTLAVSSRVSLAWLELAGPILYEHITIRSKDQLEMMIRSDSVLASIAPSVSLDQTRSFTYVLSVEANRKAVDISRPIVSAPVHVDELAIELPEATNHPYPSGDISLNVLLASFDPTHLHLLGRPASRSRVDCTFSIPYDSAWSQLRKITFVNSLTNRIFATIAFVVDRSPLLDLVFDVSTLGQGTSGLEVTLKCILGDLRRKTTGAVAGPAFGHVQVWVHDEDEVTLARTRLVNCSCRSLDIGVKQLPS